MSANPNLHLILEILFNLTNGHLIPVKNTGGKGGFRLGAGKDLMEMGCVTGAA